MSTTEIWCTPFGELNEAIACHLIAKGIAKERPATITMLNDVPDID